MSSIGYQFDADHPIAMRLLISEGENAWYCTGADGASTQGSDATPDATEQAAMLLNRGAGVWAPARLLGILVLAPPTVEALSFGITRADGTQFHDGSSQGFILTIPTTFTANNWIELGGVTANHGFAIVPSSGNGVALTAKLLFSVG